MYHLRKPTNLRLGLYCDSHFLCNSTKCMFSNQKQNLFSERHQHMPHIFIQYHGTEAWGLSLLQESKYIAFYIRMTGHNFILDSYDRGLKTYVLK